VGGGRDRSVHAGRHPPELPGKAYFDIAAEVKRRAPGMHVHAFYLAGLAILASP